MGLLWTPFYVQVLPPRGKLQEADKKGRGYYARKACDKCIHRL